MTDKNNAQPDNSSPLNSSEENQDRGHLERVVDELRMVLSDLGRPSKKQESVGEPLSDEKEAAIPQEKNLVSDEENTPFDTFKPDQSTQEISSDADFWNGNVLGWPNTPGSDSSNFPDSTEEEHGSDQPRVIPEVKEGIGHEADHPLAGGSFLNAEELEETGNPPLPDEQATPRPSAYGSVETQDPSNWERADLPDSTPVLPEAPLSPLEQAQSKETPPGHPIASNPFAPSLDDFMGKAQTEKTGPQRGAPNQGLDPFTVPIPETVNKKAESVSAVGPSLNLEETELKPKSLVQIACIFPEGQERSGQSFVSKLREAGEKAKIALNIQAVFVHPWTTENVDIGAWQKSAILSGADVMFVLVSKGNSGALKSLNAVNISGIKNRVIYLEQVPFKTLYADILVELYRGK